MNKKLGFIILGMFLVFSFSMVSAKTVILGTVYDSNGIGIDGAYVNVSCAHDGTNNYNYAVSNLDGDYFVYYNETGINACDGGDVVTVVAEKDGEFGISSKSVTDDAILDIDLAIINITVPEFKFIVGMVALLAGVGVFFFVRRE